MVLKMLLLIFLVSIMVFWKLVWVYFVLLEVLCYNYMLVIVNLDMVMFVYLVGLLDMGVKCLDVSILL